MENIDKLLRQIEIAVFIFENPDKYSDFDLGEHFNLSDSSIHRDMKALRRMGIVIHSRKKTYFTELTQNQINKLIKILDCAKSIPEEIKRVV